MDAPSVGVATLRARAADLLVKVGVFVVAAVATVVALGSAQLVAGWIVGRLAAAWPVVDPATVPFTVVTVTVVTLLVLGIGAATILLPALAPFVAVWVVDPVVVQRLLGHRPDGGDDERARPAARPFLSWGQAGITAGLLVTGLGVTVLYWAPVLPGAILSPTVAGLAALLPAETGARVLAFLYLGVGGTIVGRPRDWYLRLDVMPLRIVANRPLRIDEADPITPVAETGGGGEASGGRDETRVWGDGTAGGGETLVYDPAVEADGAADGSEGDGTAAGDEADEGDESDQGTPMTPGAGGDGEE